MNTEVRSRVVADWLQRHWEFPESEQEPAQYHVELTELAEPPLRPSSPAHELTLHGVTLRCIAGEGEWWLGDVAAGAHLELRPHGSRISVWGATDPQRGAAAFAALFVALSESMRASGLLSLHAAVIVKDGRATMLAGRSGVGKSTTLWRAMNSGWKPLAEDFAWLNPATLTIHGWDRGLRLTTDARERFAADTPLEQFRTDPDGKLFLGYEQLQGPVVRRAWLARLVLLERDPAEQLARETLSPLSARDAVRVWWEAAGVPLSPATRARQSADIAALARTVHAVRLELGDGALPL